MEIPNSSGWHSRGFLPHYDVHEQPQFITYRLIDSLPSTIMQKLSEELKHFAPEKRDAASRHRIEEYLDKGVGSCVLQNPAVAEMVEQNLIHFHEKRYRLHAWVIMPNHVHVLLSPHNDFFLADIVHSWKSYTAKKANAILGQRGEFWQREYYDRMIRNEAHFRDVIAYIYNNPVKAGLCQDPMDWQFSSVLSFHADLPF